MYFLYYILSKLYLKPELASRSNLYPATITTPGLLAQLREEQFDVAFSEALDYCGFGRLQI